MKRLIYTTVIGLAMTMAAYTQSPQAFNYQSVVRDSAGNPITNAIVAFKLSIQEGQTGGQVIYWERHVVMTNQFGSVNLRIGSGGSASQGNWEDINWREFYYFLKVELDPSGGYDYSDMGTSQFASVPYALHASEDDDWIIMEDTVTINGESKKFVRIRIDGDVGIGVFDPKASLHVGHGPAQEDDLLQIGNDASHRIRMESTGVVHFRFNGDTYGWESTGQTPEAMHYIKNSYDVSGENPCGLKSEIVHTNTGDESYSVCGIMHGRGTSIYGFCDNEFGNAVYGFHNSKQNTGKLGTPEYGVYGSNLTVGTSGYIGGDYGVWGKHSGVHGNYGRIGDPDYGVFGKDGTYENFGYFGYVNCGAGGHLINDASGHCGVHGWAGAGDSPMNNGNGYAYYQCIGGTMGTCVRDSVYWFGVMGHTAHNTIRTGGVLGADNDGTIWGSLGYMDELWDQYAGYFQGDILVNGNIYAPLLPNLGFGYPVKYNIATKSFYYETISMTSVENITALDDDYEKLFAVSPKTYTRPGTPDVWEIGYMPEDFVQAGLERLISYSMNGQPEGVNYEKIVLYTNENVRALREENRQLRKMLDDMYQRLRNLEEQLK